MEHLQGHEHAFINYDNIVVQVAVFDENSHNNHQMFQFFCDTYNYKKAICCCTYGKPYMGDTWDEENKTWLETAPRTSE
jgi:hypothetical protein